MRVFLVIFILIFHQEFIQAQVHKITSIDDNLLPIELQRKLKSMSPDDIINLNIEKITNTKKYKLYFSNGKLIGEVETVKRPGNVSGNSEVLEIDLQPDFCCFPKGRETCTPDWKIYQKWKKEKLCDSCRVKYR
jgi:hypothetical protein